MEKPAYETEGNQERHKTMEKYPPPTKTPGEEEKKCDMCQVPVSVKHFLSECPKFVKQRQDEINTDLKVALGVNCNVLSIEGFLTEIGLLNKL
ncbi:hypothetical protein JTB14_034487 [Gonioctena quinquepunctata]|nr:hypothetical protein JTB14_034487 [Gonioctena quinquepunctata]